MDRPTKPLALPVEAEQNAHRVTLAWMGAMDDDRPMLWIAVTVRNGADWQLAGAGTTLIDARVDRETAYGYAEQIVDAVARLDQHSTLSLSRIVDRLTWATVNDLDRLFRFVRHWEGHDSPRPQQAPTPVEMVVASYEWTCPACGKRNQQFSATLVAVCTACLRNVPATWRHVVD